jgi:hypothetical protein
MPAPAGSTLLASHPSSVNPIVASRHSVCAIKWLRVMPCFFAARTASSTAFVQKRYAHGSARAPQPPHARRHMHARARIMHACMRMRTCAHTQTHTDPHHPHPPTPATNYIHSTRHTAREDPLQSTTNSHKREHMKETSNRAEASRRKQSNCRRICHGSVSTRSFDTSNSSCSWTSIKVAASQKIRSLCVSQTIPHEVWASFSRSSHRFSLVPVRHWRFRNRGIRLGRAKYSRMTGCVSYSRAQMMFSGPMPLLCRRPPHCSASGTKCERLTRRQTPLVWAL